MELAAFQDAFATALLTDDARATPPAVARLMCQPGFAVYRNTVMKACIDALQANYPTVERVVGEEWLRAAAAVYARGRLPSEPSLLMYGCGFPAFLDRFEPAQAVPYLAALARVDRAWTEAHVAADAPLLEPAVLAALDASAMAAVALVVHPAARWVWHGDWPIWTLWQRNRAPIDAEPESINWTGEAVLITRPVGAVQVEPLTRGGIALLDASARGESVADAVAAALAVDPELDLAPVIHQLLRAGAFARLQPLAPEVSQ